ncbi:MAG: ABC transporter ATP-binding protein/permease [Candidatus Helarchaeota archaeon]|nr:ABC transporter ATP-binding protein/permease [Candidatus Helarchaeota archaeon]
MTEKKRETPEPQIQGPRVAGPGPGSRPGGPPFMRVEKAHLEHQRGTLWRWMLSYLRPHAGKYIAFAALLIAATVISAYTPVLSSMLIDRGIIGEDIPFLLNTAAIYVAFIAFNALANYFAQYYLGKIGQFVVFSVRNDIIDKLQQMSMTYFDRKPSGDIISITTNDVDQLNLLMAGQLVQIFTSAASIGVTIVFMFMLNPYLACLSLVIFPIFFIMMRIFTRIVSKLFTQTRKTISKVTSTIQENITGAKVVQAFGQEDKKTREFEIANEENYQAMYRVRRIFSTFFPLMMFVTQILTAAILYAGGYAVLGGISFLGSLVTVGVLSAFITFLAQFFQPFMGLMQTQNVIESAMAAADRIYGLLQEEVDLPDPEEPNELKDVRGTIDFEDVSFGYRLVEQEISNGESKLIAPLKPITTQTAVSSPDLAKKDSGHNNIPMDSVLISRIVNNLEKMLHRQSIMPAGTTGGGMGGEGGAMIGGGSTGNVRQMLRMLVSMPIPAEIHDNFPEIVKKALEEERILIERERSVGFVLDHVSIHVDAGKTLAIVGETGAGKTTMIKLIARFYDVNSGAVKIDNMDVRSILKKNLRYFIGIVPQDSFLFTGTIRENLLYGIHDLTPEIEAKVIEVSKFLGLHNFIEAQPEKYETLLKENASNISIGQRQLIAFARALIADPRILILDEATSSVDPYTESLIQDALDRAREGRTTVIIAHRLSTIKNADQIIVLSKETKGIIEEGTHEELLALPNGKYRRLLEMQQL